MQKDPRLEHPRSPRKEGGGNPRPTSRGRHAPRFLHSLQPQPDGRSCSLFLRKTAKPHFQWDTPTGAGDLREGQGQKNQADVPPKEAIAVPNPVTLPRLRGQGVRRGEPGGSRTHMSLPGVGLTASSAGRQPSIISLKPAFPIFLASCNNRSLFQGAQLLMHARLQAAHPSDDLFSGH